MKPILSSALFSLVLFAAPASADPLRLAQAPSAAPAAQPTGEAAPAQPKPAKKKPKAAAAGDASGNAAAKKDSDYLRTLQAPRRITKEDLEDDPSSPASARLRPMLTPEGRPAMGGRF